MTSMELRLASRRGENLLVTLVVPLILLVFLDNVELISDPTQATIDVLVPGILGLALLSTGMVALGIATAFERSSGVLKRLAGAPLPTGALIGAKTTVVIGTVLLQVVLIVAVAWLLGWDPPIGIPDSLLAALPWLVLGTLASAGIGLLMAGRLPAETVLALANGLFVLAIVAGGIVIPLDRLPAIVAVPASILPPALIGDLLRGSMVPGGTVVPLEAMALLIWTVVLLVMAARTFRATDER
jgi:ABC-2 type transport system permease protein